MNASALWVIALGISMSACAAEEMHPGESCGSCHVATKTRSWDKGDPFGAAGTAYAAPGARASRGIANADVEISDSNGTTVALRTNDVGNFFTKTPLTPPLRVKITKDGATATMQSAPSGDCNSCHRASPGSPGRVHVPEQARVANGR